MTIDKDLWDKSFGALDPSSLPSWPCPACGNSLVLDRNSLNYRKNAVQYNPADFQNENFEENLWLGLLTAFATAYEKMQWIQHKFVGFLECKSCGETIAFSGRAEIPRKGTSQASYLKTKIYPEYFSPPLPFFSLDNRYPTSIKQSINKSFGLVFNDAASAAGSIRQAIESLLDELGIPRDSQDKRRLTLHDRIKKFGDVNKEHAELLDAIRFLGNEGSHSGKINRKDLISAFEVLDHVLDEIFIRLEIRKKIMESGKDLADTYRPKAKS